MQEQVAKKQREPLPAYRSTVPKLAPSRPKTAAVVPTKRKTVVEVAPDLSKDTVKPPFKAKRGDALDEMLSEVIGRNNCELPISRIGDGHYMFGSKKIYAKIIANKLVVRVGGGYMNMDEFISTYAESERLKLERLDPAYIESLHKSGEDRHNINAVPLYGRSGSPKYGARSPKAAGSPK